MLKQRNLQQGFTLIEALIVLAIIGILSAIAVPFYGEYTVKVRIAEVQRYALALTVDADAIYQDTGQFPNDAAVTIPSHPTMSTYTRGSNTTSRTIASKAYAAGYVSTIQVSLKDTIFSGAANDLRMVYQGLADVYGNTEWKCVYHPTKQIPTRYLPADCQTVME